MAQNQTLLESFKLPLTRSCPIPLNLGLVSFFLHLFDEDAIFGWAWGKLSLFHLVCEDQRDFMLFFTGDRGIVNSFGKCDGTSDFPHVLFFLETIEARELLSRQISHHL